MGNTYDEQEEDMDELEAEAGGEEEGREQVAAEAESDGPAPAANRSEDSPEERTVSSRQKQRDEMQREIEEFLARGGKISQIEPNVTADPPRKPDSDYGSRPI